LGEGLGERVERQHVEEVAHERGLEGGHLSFYKIFVFEKKVRKPPRTQQMLRPFFLSYF
jgi:hypothetical protein